MADQAWQPFGFFEGMKDWAQEGSPSRRLSYEILDWIDSLKRGPFDHETATAEPSVEHLWSVQFLDDRPGYVVACLYYVYARDHTVQCQGFSREEAPFPQGVPGPIDLEDHDLETEPGGAENDPFLH